MAYETIVVETDGPVGIIQLDRPDALNALSSTLMDELGAAARALDADDQIACIVLLGSEKAFAAGADIKEIKDLSFIEAYGQELITRNWEEVTRCRKPVIAGVAGYALGGGCELAMMCDVVIAADNAKFGQPEITIGVIPGAGGTQRLTRLVGKAKAMEMCLTGRMMDAEEAERAGLVSRIVAADDLRDEVLKVARKIADLSRPIVMMTKESVNMAYETFLGEGIRFERRLFHAAFGTEDQKEGMTAFVEKRKPQFKDK